MEKKIASRTLFSKKPAKIPWPEFYVLYNGIEPFPDETVLRLSDLFEKPQSLGLPEEAYPLLELEVKVININEGRNELIANRCKMLSEYSAFVSKVRNYLSEKISLEEAVKESLKYCRKHDILSE